MSCSFPRAILAAFLLVMTTRCMQLPSAVDRTPAGARSAKRVLFLAYGEFALPVGNEAMWLAALPQHRRLLSRAVVFPSAETGQLGDGAAALFPTLVTGRVPRQLPWQDAITRDAKRAAVPVTATPPVRAGKQLREKTKGLSLPALLAKGSPGSVRVIGADAFLAEALAAGAVAPQVARDDAATGAAVVEALEDRGTRGIFAVFRDVTRAEAALGAIVDKIEAENGWNDLAVVLVAPRGTPAAPVQDASTLPAPLAEAWRAGCCEAAIASPTAWRLWTKAREPVRLGSLTKQLKATGEVLEIHAKYDAGQSLQYVRVYRKKDTASRSADLLAAQAAPGAPDLVALLDSPVPTTGLCLALVAPGLQPPLEPPLARVVARDVAPMVLELLGLPIPEEMEGNARALEPILNASPRMSRNPAPDIPRG